MHPTKTVRDQMGREVTFRFPPQRIVSLVPSQTELLYHLGLSDEVVGQTLFCVHPAAMHASKPRVGGTKNFKPEKIMALKPDLVIGNKEENEQAGIEALEKQCPVWMSDIETLDDALEMIDMIGSLVNKEKEASATSQEIASLFAGLKVPDRMINAAYLIWRKPWMAAGRHTFITDLMKRIGLRNVFDGMGSRYPEIGEAEFARLKPELILLSSEPYPFRQQHIGELEAICPGTRIMLVDGEMFSWYGSRLLHSPACFRELIGQWTSRET